MTKQKQLREGGKEKPQFRLRAYELDEPQGFFAIVEVYAPSEKSLDRHGYDMYRVTERFTFASKEIEKHFVLVETSDRNLRVRGVNDDPKSLEALRKEPLIKRTLIGIRHGYHESVDALRGIAIKKATELAEQRFGGTVEKLVDNVELGRKVRAWAIIEDK